jgi:hypothetical protein
MGGSLSKRTTSTFTLLLVLLPLAPLAAAQAGHKTDNQAAAAQAPLSFQEVLEAVGVLPPARLPEFLTRRPIGFSPTPQQIQKLKAAGASDDIIKLILSKAPPPAKPKPAKPVTAGVLTLTCAPAECTILIDGKPHGETANGTLQIAGLPPGHVVIDFGHEGYEGQQVGVDLAAGEPAARSVKLLPAPATQERAGRLLFNRMVQKLGGGQSLNIQGQLDLHGNAKLWQANGQMTEWQVTGHLKLASAMAFLQIEGAGLKWWTSLRGSDTKSDGSGRLKGGPVALEMEKMVRQFRDFQLLWLANRIVTGKMTLLSPNGGDEIDGHYEFSARGGAETYKFTILPDGTPQKVTVQSASGLGSGTEVVYADYAPLGPGIYPKTMAIRFGDAPQHGIELRFDSVQAVPKLSDKDFHR